MDLRRSTGGGGVRALPRYGGLATRDHDGGRRENCPYGKGSGTQGGRDGSCPEEAGRKTAERSLLAPSWGATGISDLGGRRENCPYGKGSGTQGGRDGSCPEEAGRKTAERSLLAPSWGATGISARQ